MENKQENEFDKPPLLQIDHTPSDTDQEESLKQNAPSAATQGTAATIRFKRKLDACYSGSALYLFAGPKRKSTIGSILRKSGWHVNEVDILQGGRSHDLTRKEVQERYLTELRARKYDAMYTSPPCDTFSRVKFSNNWGPRPTRTARFLRGRKGLTLIETRRNELANTLVDFNFSAMEAHVAHEDTILALEFPEDLGRIGKGEWKDERPASIFQWPNFADLIQKPHVVTGGLRQCDYGTPYVKPTRMILRFPGTAESLPSFFLGPPIFDDMGNYLGPIPRTVGKVGLAKTSKYEPFRTTTTAAWPDLLCKDLARLTILSQAGTSAKRQRVEEPGKNPPDDGLEAGGSESIRRNFPIIEPPTGYWIGGIGPPRETNSFGRKAEFHDGLGLTSPGRWPRSRRRFPEGKRWDDLRLSLRNVLKKDLDDTGILKHISALACGIDIFHKPWVEEIRNILHQWAGRQAGDYDSSKDPACPIGQPFYTQLIFSLLREARDADYMLFKTLEKGVPLGVLDQLPHHPAIAELQSKWRLPDDPGISTELEHTNYSSADDFTTQIEEQFREEQALGWMQEVSDDDFQKMFGDNRAVSALAVLQEKDKIRILHDGTHATHVNHRIRVRDRQRMPTSREMSHLLDEQRTSGCIGMAILADASKAHRRVVIQPKERGFLGCRVRPGRVWFNCVGTFGLSSASYWWSRVSGGIFRLIFALLGGEQSLDFLVFADDAQYIANNKAERFSVLLAITIALALGMPFKWAKFRGGYEVAWVGFGINFKLYAIGLTEARAGWVVKWTNQLVESGTVSILEFQSGLGRLNYASQALYYERAFLGLLYLWLGSVLRSAQSRATIPWAVRLVLKWIGRRMKDSVSTDGRLQIAPHISANPVEWFRTDAKAENKRAWIGGWEVLGNQTTLESRWFAMEITESEAPWIFAKERDPQRVIAALELLGSIVAIVLFDPDGTRGGLNECTLTGSTDNRGNSYIVSKLASTKWPITSLLIELSEQLRRRSTVLNLVWRKRDDNSEADALTNGDYKGFDPKHRVGTVFSAIPFMVLNEVMQLSAELYKEVSMQRSQRNTGDKPRKKTAAKDRLKWTDPW